MHKKEHKDLQLHQHMVGVMQADGESASTSAMHLQQWCISIMRIVAYEQLIESLAVWRAAKGVMCSQTTPAATIVVLSAICVWAAASDQAVQQMQWLLRDVRVYMYQASDRAHKIQGMHKLNNDA